MSNNQNPINYNRFSQNSLSSNQGYDLATEKQRIAEGTEEIKKGLKEKWDKHYRDAQIFPTEISGMSRELIQFLLSFQHTIFYNDLAKKFSLLQDRRDILPQITWHLCQNRNWESLIGLLQKNLELSPEICAQIGKEMTSQILYKAKGMSAGESASRTSVKMQEKNGPILEQTTLNQALQEVPEIGEQLITTERINILNFPEEVRPSLKNWLSDYTSYFGYDKISPIELGNYLFHSDNAKKLRSSDRERLTHILKAFNENTPVSINKTIKQIVFPAINKLAADENIINNTSPTSDMPSPGPQTSANNSLSDKSDVPDYNPPSQVAKTTQSQISNKQTGNTPQAANRYAIQNPAYRPLGSNLQTPSSRQDANPSYVHTAGQDLESRTSRASGTDPFSKLKTQTPDTVRNLKPVNPQNMDNRQSIGSKQPEEQKSASDNISFSSPQRLPYEYEKESLPKQKPSFSAPSAPANLPVDSYYPLASKPNTIILEKKPEPPRPAAKNVVDLREQ